MFKIYIYQRVHFTIFAEWIPVVLPEEYRASTGCRKREQRFTPKVSNLPSRFQGPFKKTRQR